MRFLNDFFTAPYFILLTVWEEFLYDMTHCQDTDETVLAVFEPSADLKGKKDLWTKLRVFGEWVAWCQNNVPPHHPEDGL